MYFATYYNGNLVKKVNLVELNSLPGDFHRFMIREEAIYKNLDPVIAVDRDGNQAKCLIGKYEFVGIRTRNNKYVVTFYDSERQDLLEIDDLSNIVEYAVSGALRKIYSTLDHPCLIEYEMAERIKSFEEKIKCLQEQISTLELKRDGLLGQNT